MRPDRSWDDYSAAAAAEDGDGTATAGPTRFPFSPKSNRAGDKLVHQDGDGNSICEFSLSALVGLATLVGEERARIERERAQTVEALSDALKSAAQREAKIMSDLVDRVRSGGAAKATPPPPSDDPAE